MGAPRGQHSGEEGLELIGLRRGVPGVEQLVPDDRAQGADHTGLVPRRLQNGLYHMGGGGLALGAGEADEGELVRRMAEPGGGGMGQGSPGVGHLYHRHPLGHAHFPLHHQGGGPLFQGGGDIVVPVGLEAGDAQEKGPGGHLAGVIFQGGDLRLLRPLHQSVGHILQ